MLGKYTAQLLEASEPAKGSDVNANLLRIEQALRGIVAIPPQTVTNNQTLALGVADLIEWTVGGNITIAMDGTKSSPGAMMIVALAQDGTGSRTTAFTGVTWVGGSAPATSTTAGARDVYLFVSIKGITNVLGIPLGPNLAVGSLAVAGLLDISGASAGQVKFPASQNASADANTLDDYEEGTWTGTLTPLTSGSITMNLTAGTYTKTGRSVTVQGSFSATSVSAPVGRLTLSGLPFTCASGVAFQPAVAVTTDALNATATTAVVGIVNPGTATIIFYHFAAGNIADMAADVKAGSQFYITATYFV